MTIFGALLIASVFMISCGEKDAKTGTDTKTSETSNKTKTADQDRNEEKESDESNEPESSSTSSNESTTSSGGSSDCEKFCDDYEAFVDDYIAIIKKQKANPNDMSILTEYQEMMSNASGWQENSKSCASNPAYAARISKITSKLASAASSL